MRLIPSCLGFCFGAGHVPASPNDASRSDVVATVAEQADSLNEKGKVDRTPDEELLVHQGSCERAESPVQTQKLTVVVDSSPASLPPPRLSLCSIKPNEVLGVTSTACVRPELLSLLVSGSSFSKLCPNPSVALSIGDSTLSWGSGTIALTSDPRVSLNGERRGSECGTVAVKMSSFEELEASVTDAIWVGQGAQGAVLKAQWRSGAAVAVKWLVSDAAAVPAAYMEALLAKMLAHPYLVQTFDYAICQLDDMFGTSSGSTPAPQKQQQQQGLQQQPGRGATAPQPQVQREQHQHQQQQEHLYQQKQQQQQQQWNLISASPDDGSVARAPAAAAAAAAAAVVGSAGTSAGGPPAGPATAGHCGLLVGLAAAAAASGGLPRGGETSPAPASLDLLGPEGEADGRRVGGARSALCDMQRGGGGGLGGGAATSTLSGPGGAGTLAAPAAPSLALVTAAGLTSVVVGGGGLPEAAGWSPVAARRTGPGMGPEAPVTPLSHDAPSTTAFDGEVVVSEDSFDGRPMGSAAAQPVDCVDVLKQLGAAPGKFVVQIVSEWCDEGTLHAAIRRGVFRPQGGRNRTWALRALLRTAREVALGLCHLHSLNIIHGDLKPGNVLLKSSRVDSRGFVAKVADFGLSRLCRQHEEYVATADWGTVPYMAGEYLDNKLCKSSDVYSFGVLLWQMYTGRAPFAGHHEAQVAVGVMLGDLQLDWPANMPPPLSRLGQACCRHEPEQRPTFKEVAVALAGIETQVRDAHNRAKMVRRCDSGAPHCGPRPPGPGPSFHCLPHPGLQGGLPAAEGGLLAPAGSSHRSVRLAGAGSVMSSTGQGYTTSRLLDSALGAGAGAGTTLHLGRVPSQSLLQLRPGYTGPLATAAAELSPVAVERALGARGVASASPFSVASAAGALSAAMLHAQVQVQAGSPAAALGGRVLGLHSTSRLHIRTSFADTAPLAPVPASSCATPTYSPTPAAVLLLAPGQQQLPPTADGAEASERRDGEAATVVATAAEASAGVALQTPPLPYPYPYPRLYPQPHPQRQVFPCCHLPGRAQSQAEPFSPWQWQLAPPDPRSLCRAHTTLDLSQSLGPTAEVEPEPPGACVLLPPGGAAAEAAAPAPAPAPAPATTAVAEAAAAVPAAAGSPAALPDSGCSGPPAPPQPAVVPPAAAAAPSPFTLYAGADMFPPAEEAEARPRARQVHSASVAAAPSPPPFLPASPPDVPQPQLQVQGLSAATSLLHLTGSCSLASTPAPALPVPASACLRSGAPCAPSLCAHAHTVPPPPPAPPLAPWSTRSVRTYAAGEAITSPALPPGPAFWLGTPAGPTVASGPAAWHLQEQPQLQLQPQPHQPPLGQPQAAPLSPQAALGPPWGCCHPAGGFGIPLVWAPPAAPTDLLPHIAPAALPASDASCFVAPGTGTDSGSGYTRPPSLHLLPHPHPWTQRSSGGGAYVGHDSATGGPAGGTPWGLNPALAGHGPGGVPFGIRANLPPGTCDGPAGWPATGCSTAGAAPTAAAASSSQPTHGTVGGIAYSCGPRTLSAHLQDAVACGSSGTPPSGTRCTQPSAPASGSPSCLQAAAPAAASAAPAAPAPGGYDSELRHLPPPPPPLLAQLQHPDRSAAGPDRVPEGGLGDEGAAAGWFAGATPSGASLWLAGAATSAYYLYPSPSPSAAPGPAAAAAVSAVPAASPPPSAPGSVSGSGILPSAPPCASSSLRRLRSGWPALQAASGVLAGNIGSGAGPGTGAGVPSGLFVCPGGAGGRRPSAVSLLTHGSPRGHFGGHLHPHPHPHAHPHSLGYEDGREGLSSMMTIPLAPLQEATEGPNSAGMESGAAEGGC